MIIVSQHIARLQDSHRQALVSGRAKIQKRINRIPRRYWSKTIQELTDDLEAPRDLPQLTYPTSSLKTIKEDKYVLLLSFRYQYFTNMIDV